MKKLIRGIVEFRKAALPGYREKFSRLALGQSPDVLFIACSDSRVVPNLFASTDPGDLFVVRNVGNLIPICGKDGQFTTDKSEAAAIEFAVKNLEISDIIVCGHSDCGAMHAILEGLDKELMPNLRAWLQHGEPSLAKLSQGQENQVNVLSQLNVLEQIEHLRSYPVVRTRLAERKLRLHGWWFELSTADVYTFEESSAKFVLLDEKEAGRVLARLV